MTNRITAYVINRVETPDGPAHVQEPVELEPFCLDCGENELECDCGGGE